MYCLGLTPNLQIDGIDRIDGIKSIRKSDLMGFLQLTPYDRCNSHIDALNDLNVINVPWGLDKLNRPDRPERPDKKSERIEQRPPNPVGKAGTSVLTKTARTDRWPPGVAGVTRRGSHVG